MSLLVNSYRPSQCMSYLCCVCRLWTFTAIHRWSVGFIVNGALQSLWLLLLLIKAPGLHLAGGSPSPSSAQTPEPPGIKRQIRLCICQSPNAQLTTSSKRLTPRLVDGDCGTLDGALPAWLLPLDTTVRLWLCIADVAVVLRSSSLPPPPDLGHQVDMSLATLSVSDVDGASFAFTHANNQTAQH